MFKKNEFIFYLFIYLFLFFEKQNKQTNKKNRTHRIRVTRTLVYTLCAQDKAQPEPVKKSSLLYG